MGCCPVILLDTHIWVRWLAGDPSLAASIVDQVAEADELAVSAISCWEVAYLAKRGRLQLSMPITDWLDIGLRRTGVVCLAVGEEIALTAAKLPDHHRDPADRIIIATALARRLPIVSLDRAFASYSELNGLLFPISP